MSPRTKQQFEEIREEKSDLIINTALKLFAEFGYHQTTISKISKEAGISKGLMYNYFESKESLLKSIILEFVKLMGELINPDGDEEITCEEMSNFFDLIIESMQKKREYWAVLFQLSMQKEVISMIFANHQIGNLSGNIMQLGYKYFAERFEKPEEELLFFRSVIKGFALILVLTPEICSEELIDSFKQRLKKLFIREKM